MPERRAVLGDLLAAIRVAIGKHLDLIRPAADSSL